MPIPISTPTYRNSSGGISVAPSPQPQAYGGSPSNGSATSNGWTVFNNNGGGGTAMDSSGNIRSGDFTFSPFSGRSVFVPG
jgi:hypothetical protein